MIIQYSGSWEICSDKQESQVFVKLAEILSTFKNSCLERIIDGINKVNLKQAKM